MLADIMKAALKYADRPAFVIEDETYTYSRLVGQAISISHTLRNLKENVVGIAAENRIETYASILAVLLAGKTYVILHPDYPAERKRQIARQAGIGLLLYGPEGNTVLPPDVAERAVFQSQLALLNDIADLLNRHHCRVRILISPDYNRKCCIPKIKKSYASYSVKRTCLILAVSMNIPMITIIIMNRDITVPCWERS